jgi:uncharacterized protein YndB with AHSA1/START domain
MMTEPTNTAPTTPAPTTPAATGGTGHPIEITRLFDAPRELVFRAWTEPARFAQWFGGREAAVPVESVSMDLRPGGSWRATMRAGETEIAWKGEYREVAPPGRLVLTITDQPGDERDVITVVLTDVGGKTEMAFRQDGRYLSAEQLPQTKAGWSGFFEVLAEELAAA